MFAHLYEVFSFLILHKFNSIYLVSRLFKWKKEIFRKDLQLIPCLEFISLNILPTGFFLKHPCEQCSSPLNSGSVSLETCHIFSRFSVIISKPAIYIYVCIYIYICIYVYMYIYVYVYIYIQPSRECLVINWTVNSRYGPCHL